MRSDMRRRAPRSRTGSRSGARRVERSRIKRLSSFVANQIAAGEVVERPASIVKELIENSLDAQARRIVLTIEQGGVKRVRVSDDGVGIHADDLQLAVCPHATSKIDVADDLEGVATLGFQRRSAREHRVGCEAVDQHANRRCGKRFAHRCGRRVRKRTLAPRRIRAARRSTSAICSTTRRRAANS